MYSEKIVLEDKLNELIFENEDEMVISLKGKWGIGKTYFWKEFILKKIKQDKEIKYAYVSLFGKSSVNQVTDSIILQVDKKASYIKKFNNFAGGINFCGLSIGSTLTLLPPSDFKKVIICFDDFERLSSNLKLKEILGIISELKEQKKCKIVMINNFDQLFRADLLDSKKLIRNIHDKEDKIETNFKNPRYYISETNSIDILEEYNEKIIDYELTFNPTIEENYDLIKDKLKYFDKSLLLKMLKNHHSTEDKHNAFNIRMMKKVIDKLNLFSFIESHKINIEISNSIMIYIFEKIYRTYIDRNKFNQIDLSWIKSNLDDALKKNYILDSKSFMNKIDYLSDKENNRKQETESNKYLEKAEFMYEKNKFDLSGKDEIFNKEIYDLLKKYSDNVVELNLYKYKYLIDQLIKDTPNSKRLKELYVKTCKKYIKRIFDEKRDQDRLLSNEYFGLYYENDELKKYINQLQRNFIHKKITSLSEIIKTIKIPMDTRGWSEKEVYILEEIPIKTHIKFMKESPIYLEQVFLFALWSNNFSGNKPFSKAINNIMSAMEELKEKRKYKTKIDSLIQRIKNVER